MDDDDRAGPAATPGPDPTVGATLAVGAAVAVAVFFGLSPYLVNLEGPFGERARLGALVTVAVALAVGVLAWSAALTLARRSTLALVVAGLVVVAAGVVLFPVPVDRHESFVERPNERSECRGWSFSSYPPGVMDGSSTVYCVGLERRTTPG